MFAVIAHSSRLVGNLARSDARHFRFMSVQPIWLGGFFFILPILDLVRGEARLCTVVYSIKKESTLHGQGLSQVFSWNVLSFFVEEKFVHVVRMFFLKNI